MAEVFLNWIETLVICILISVLEHYTVWEGVFFLSNNMNIIVKWLSDHRVLTG